MARTLQSAAARTHPLFAWTVTRDRTEYPGSFVARLVTGARRHTSWSGTPWPRSMPICHKAWSALTRRTWWRWGFQRREFRYPATWNFASCLRWTFRGRRRIGWYGHFRWRDVFAGPGQFRRQWLWRTCHSRLSEQCGYFLVIGPHGIRPPPRPTKFRTRTTRKMTKNT
jgi:hypothetical protein